MNRNALCAKIQKEQDDLIAIRSNGRGRDVGRGGIMTDRDDLALRYQKLDRTKRHVGQHSYPPGTSCAICFRRSRFRSTSPTTLAEANTAIKKVVSRISGMIDGGIIPPVNKVGAVPTVWIKRGNASWGYAQPGTKRVPLDPSFKRLETARVVTQQVDNEWVKP